MVAKKTSAYPNLFCPMCLEGLLCVRREQYSSSVFKFIAKDKKIIVDRTSRHKATHKSVFTLFCTNPRCEFEGEYSSLEYCLKELVYFADKEWFYVFDDASIEEAGEKEEEEEEVEGKEGEEKEGENEEEEEVEVEEYPIIPKLLRKRIVLEKIKEDDTITEYEDWNPWNHVTD